MQKKDELLKSAYTSDFVGITYTHVFWRAEHEYDHENRSKWNFQGQPYKIIYCVVLYFEYLISSVDTSRASR